MATVGIKGLIYCFDTDFEVCWQGWELVSFTRILDSHLDSGDWSSMSVWTHPESSCCSVNGWSNGNVYAAWLNG